MRRKKTLKDSAKKRSSKNTLQVDVRSEALGFSISASQIKQVILFAAKELHFDTKSEVSVIFVKDAFMRKLNKKYRNKDKTTDVLSFPMDISGSGISMLGDIVISLQTASFQSKSLGVSIHEEVCRLLVHGFLHLLGYDHENVAKREAEKMRRAEQKILTKILKSNITTLVKSRQKQT